MDTPARQTQARHTAMREECERVDEALVRAFDLLGKRWIVIVLATLGSGPAGFRAVSRAVAGISDSTLSDRLAQLGAAGLVRRTVDEGPPIAVTYSLTESGRALLPALEQVTRWAEEHLSARPDRGRSAAASVDGR